MRMNAVYGFFFISPDGRFVDHIDIDSVLWKARSVSESGKSSDGELLTNDFIPGIRKDHLTIGNFTDFGVPDKFVIFSGHGATGAYPVSLVEKISDGIIKISKIVQNQVYEINISRDDCKVSIPEYVVSDYHTAYCEAQRFGAMVLYSLAKLHCNNHYSFLVQPETRAGSLVRVDNIIVDLSLLKTLSNPAPNFIRKISQNIIGIFSRRTGQLICSVSE